MNDFNRTTAKEIVRRALLEVADFNGDIEEFTFDLFQPFHISVFLNSLKQLVNKTPCYDEHGNINSKEYYNINLSLTLFKTWKKIRVCIDYVYNYHSRAKSETGKIQLI
jgi:hypothetical protein